MAGVFIDSGSNVVANVVLTKKGRESLAAGLLPVSFALFDDGVDYSLWDASLANPGSLIEQTPLLEPSSAQEASPQHRLLSIANTSLAYLPTMQFTQANITLAEQAGSPQAVTSFVHYTQQGFTVPAGLVDSKFIVECDSKFLSVFQGGVAAPIVSTSPAGVARYVLSADAGTSGSGGGMATFAIKDNPLSDIDMQTYGSIGGLVGVGSRQIRTQIQVRGVESGLAKTLKVYIEETTGLHAA